MLGNGGALEVPADGRSIKRTVQSKRRKGDRVSIKLLQLTAVVIKACVVVNMKGDRRE